MKAMDKLIAKIDKKLERFDPIWQAEHGTGGQRTRYYDKTGVAKWREWRGVKDTAFAFSRWLITWVKMGGLVMRDPVRMVKAFWKYRWLSAYLVSPSMIDKWIEGDRGMALRADLTATMIVPKPGLTAGDGPAHCGRVVVAPIAYIEPLV